MGVIINPDLFDRRYDEVHDDYYFNADQKVFLVDSREEYNTGAFDLVEKHVFPSYVESENPGKIMFYGELDEVSEAVEKLNAQEVVLDERAVLKESARANSYRKILDCQLRQFLPGIKENNLSPEVLEDTEVLEENGMERLSTARGINDI